MTIRPTPFLGKGSIAILPLSCALGFLMREVLSQVFLPNHPFIPPVINEKLKLSTQRGPCPGLNILANHGYINRDGRNISIDDVARVGEEVLGISTGILKHTGISFVAGGLQTAIQAGEIAFNLFDLTTFDNDGSFFYNDKALEHDQAYSRFNATLVDQLLERAVNGLINFDDLLSYRTERVVDSRQRNPKNNFDAVPDEVMEVNLLLIASVGATDESLQFIRADYIESFFLEGRIPDDYVTRQQRGLPPFSTEHPVFDTLMQRATDSLLDSFSLVLHTDEDLSKKAKVGISIGVLAVILLGLVVYFTYRRRRKQTPESTGASITNNEAVSDVTENDLGQRRESVVISSLEKVNPKTLSWRNLSIYLGAPEKPILSNVSGEVNPGELLSIMGPSGSGKYPIFIL